MTCRRLLVLVDALPSESMLHRDGLWTQDNELAAVACEISQVWMATLLGAWMQKGAKLPPLMPITHPDRPGSKAAPKSQRKKATSDPAKLAALFS